MSFPTRKVGKDDVSAIGFGTMGLGGICYGEAGSDEERFKVLDKLIELGCTFWDTADVYGDAEELIGKYFVHNPSARDKVFLATKFALRFTSGTEFTVSGKPEYVREAFERSIKKLSVDKIDLYYFHRVDSTTPVEITVAAMAELVKEGRVRYLGISEPSPDSLRRAHAVHPMAAVQVEYSPFFLNIERKGHLLDAARELGVAVVAYCPLGRGLLTGQYKSWADLGRDDARKIIPKFAEANFPKILDLVQEFQRVASKHNATSGQIALAWLLAQGTDIIPIPGSKHLKFIEENVAAVNIKLTSEDVEDLRHVITAADIQGGQYTGRFLDVQYADSPPLA